MYIYSAIISEASNMRYSFGVNVVIYLKIKSEVK